MELKNAYTVLDAAAPKRYSDEFCEKYGAYDNSGVLVDAGEEIRGALFSLDFSFAAIEEAKKRGANLLVTHHPAIYAKIGEIQAEDPLGGKLVECIKNGISVVSMHLNLDAAKEGVDESLSLAVCAAASSGKTDEKIMLPLLDEGVGYGRVYTLTSPAAFQVFLQNFKAELCAENLSIFGERTNPVQKVASFCGAGGDEEAVDFAARNGADTLISSDFKHHVILYAVEKGLRVIAPTHYASENYGFKKYYEKIRKQLSFLPCFYFEDERLL